MASLNFLQAARMIARMIEWDEQSRLQAAEDFISVALQRGISA